MAYAELGRYPEAVARQQEAIDMARRQGQTTLIESLETELRRYEEGQPSRTPWPAIVFAK